MKALLLVVFFFLEFYNHRSQVKGLFFWQRSRQRTHGRIGLDAHAHGRVLSCRRDGSCSAASRRTGFFFSSGSRQHGRTHWPNWRVSAVDGGNPSWLALRLSRGVSLLHYWRLLPPLQQDWRFGACRNAAAAVCQIVTTAAVGQPTTPATICCSRTLVLLSLWLWSILYSRRARTLPFLDYRRSSFIRRLRAISRKSCSNICQHSSRAFSHRPLWIIILRSSAASSAA